MEKFILFMGCFGNGVTVANAAVMEHGDYKTVAHISPAGNLKLYVATGYIPAPEMEKINRAAQLQAEKFRAAFESLPPLSQYDKILSWMPIQKLLDNDKDSRPLSEKLPDLREWYYQNR